MPNWILRLIGRRIATKLELEETMDDKPKVTNSTVWWKSKAKISALITILVAAIHPIAVAWGHPEIVVPNWFIEMLIGMGIYGIRDAIPK